MGCEVGGWVKGERSADVDDEAMDMRMYRIFD